MEVTPQPTPKVQGGMHAVNLDDFPDHVTALHELNNAGFSEEFKVSILSAKRSTMVTLWLF